MVLKSILMLMNLQFNDLFRSSHYSEQSGGKIRTLICEFIKGLALSFDIKNWAVKVAKSQTGILFVIWEGKVAFEIHPLLVPTGTLMYHVASFYCWHMISDT